MRKILIILILFFCIAKANAQKYSVHSNIAGLATATINVGGEIKLNKNITIEATCFYNPIKVMNNTSLQFSVNYYLITPFYKWFVFCGSTHSYFNFSNKSKNTQKGWLNGAGLGIGYTIPISKKINLTIASGLGLYKVKYKKYKTVITDQEDQYTYHTDKLMLLPSKLDVKLQILF